MKELLVVGDASFVITPAQLQRLAERPMSVYYHASGPLSIARMASATALWGTPPPEQLAGALFLEWHHLSQPCEHQYAHSRLYADPNVILTKPVGVFGAAAAEHVLSLLLRLCRGDELTDSCFDRPRELTGATVAVLGLGDVGQAVARMLHRFSVRVLGVRRHLLAVLPHVEVYDLYDLPTVLEQADMVVCCLPGTSETTGLLSCRALAAMKMGALLVHIGHSSVMDFDALYNALDSGRLAGAGLDTVGAEGLPEDHPLRSLPMVRITRTAAGESESTDQRRFVQFETQLDRYLSARRPLDAVDFFKGY